MDELDHDNMGYKKVKKDFYLEDQYVAEMSKEHVTELR